MSETPYEKSIFDADLSPFVSTHLDTAVKWARFLAVSGFVLTGLAVVVKILIAIKDISTADSFVGPEQVGEGIAFLMMILPFFYMSLVLYKFYRAATVARVGNNPALFNEAFRYLKTFFKSLGITIIVLFGLMILGFIIAFIRR